LTKIKEKKIWLILEELILEELILEELILEE